jgi:hypothetical protein
MIYYILMSMSILDNQLFLKTRFLIFKIQTIEHIMELNKYSKTITQDETQPAAQAMLYGMA